jgi:urate oxidase
MKVTRHDHGHDLREWSVQVLLKGDFQSAHLDGDNSRILPTDTMKNTVYSIARESKAVSMEEYAKELCDYLLVQNPQVSSASIQIEGALWKRITVDGTPHPSAFMHGSAELQTTSVERCQEEEFRILSGLDNLVVLKTANSGFEGFIKDRLTTLQETNDRLFGTAITAQWHYLPTNLAYEEVRRLIREQLIRTFAIHDSKSVQQTLYAMAESALSAVAEIDEIKITMPNKHCLLVDLSRFAQDNPNEIFVPTDEPHGFIEASVRRSS